MSHLLLILEPRGQRAERTPEEGREAYRQMVEFGQELQRSGQLLATESLLGDERGTRVQCRDGQARLIDGPFVETKEMVGGFFLVRCKSHDEAVALARRCPAAQWATVEVRALGPCFA